MMDSNERIVNIEEGIKVIAEVGTGVNEAKYTSNRTNPLYFLQHFNVLELR
jgi:hypothetical protein